MDLSIRGGVHQHPSRNPSNFGGQYIYWELFYHDLYTNKKNIIGNWIGRMAKGFSLGASIGLVHETLLNSGTRHANVDSNFIPGAKQ